MGDVHTVFTCYDPETWSVTSPQAPGMVGMYSSARQAQRDVTRLLESAGVHPGEGALVVHEEHYVTSPQGREFLIRFTPGTDSYRAANFMYAGVTSGLLPEAGNLPQARTGEYYIISVDRRMPLFHIEAQVPDDDVYLVYSSLDGSTLHGTPYRKGITVRGESMIRGLTMDMTIEQAWKASNDHPVSAFPDTPTPERLLTAA